MPDGGRHIHTYGQANVFVSVVSYLEQILCCHAKLNSVRRTAELVHWYELMLGIMDMFANLNVLPFDAAAGTVLDDLTVRKVRLKPMDLRIAAVALANGLVLVTRNVSDFGKVPGLRTADWTK